MEKRNSEFLSHHSSRDSVVGLGDKGIMVRFQVGARHICLLPIVHAGSGAPHTLLFSVYPESSPWCKVAGA